jgi:surface antigen Omp85-like protein
MRTVGLRRLFTVVALSAAAATSLAAQEPDATTRAAAIEQAQAEKLKTLHPYVPGKAEKVLNNFEDIMANGVPRWHPFLDKAYSGGGFTLGLGYAHHVSPYNMLDVRGSYTIRGYKRVEAEFTAPRLFQRRGALSLLGGWREATQVGFYGLGMNTAKAARTNYDFQQPYGSATLTLWPTRRLLMLRGAVELSEWHQRPGEGSFRSVETVYSPTTLPGLGARTTYVHGQGTVGVDWRTSPGYSRRGGFYGVTLHDYTDSDKDFGFQQLDYEVIQHFPILREAWVISLHGLARTAVNKDNQEIPFFMLPSVGGGHSVRGLDSLRFRDRNSLFVQAEWRIMLNRFLDLAFFYDAGKVTARRSDLDFDGLKSGYGLGTRFHGPFATMLRIEVARSREGTRLIFATSPIF